MFKKEFTVTGKDSGQRIDALCGKNFTIISRSRWTKYGTFTCEGVVKKPNAKTIIGQNWSVSCEEENFVNDQLVAWDKPLKVLKETDDWVVIEKPYGISMHPSVSEKSNETMVNALVHLFGQNLSENYDEIEGRQIPRPGIVHRLDKTTSGVILVAKNNKSHKFFQEHWKEFQKTYYALVEGRPPAKGKIESGIVRDEYNRRKMMAHDTERSKWSVTEFEVVEVSMGPEKNYTMLRVKILTGRTHQIRVHLSSIGFPVVGDVLYSGPESDRVMLHAAELKFKNPENGDWEEVASSLPESFS